MSAESREPVLVIIPNYVAEGKENQNRWLLTNLINSFIKHEHNVDLLIIDDGSRSMHTKAFYYSLSWLCKDSTIRYGFETMDRNQGFAATVNHGLNRAKAGHYKYAILMNNDVELIEPFVDRMISQFESIPALKVWGPRLLYPDGRVQSAGFDFSSDGKANLYDREAVVACNPGQSGTTRFVQGVTGAFMGLRVPAQLMDESFFMAYEDVDYCLKTWATGGLVMFDGAVSALHIEGATRGAGLSSTELDSQNIFKERLAQYKIPYTKIRILSANKALSQGRGNHGQEKESGENAARISEQV